MSKEFKDLREFHEKMELGYEGPPRLLDSKLTKFRRDFMQEELNEYDEACTNGDLEAMFDALLDLAYVAIGTAYLHGFPWAEGWHRVHQANMKKQPGWSERSDSHDVVKPDGWQPPVLGDLVRTDTVYGDHPDTITFAELDAFISRAWRVGVSDLITYSALALAGEAGEAANEAKKRLRDDAGELTPDRRRRIIIELGDTIYYTGATARAVGATMGEVVQEMMDKIREHRRANGMGEV